MTLRRQVLGQPLYLAGVPTNSFLLFFKGTIAAHTDNYDSEKQSRNCPVLTQHQQHRKRKSLVEKFSLYSNIRAHKRAKPALHRLINSSAATELTTSSVHTGEKLPHTLAGHFIVWLPHRTGGMMGTSHDINVRLHLNSCSFISVSSLFTKLCV